MVDHETIFDMLEVYTSIKLSFIKEIIFLMQKLECNVIILDLILIIVSKFAVI